MPTTTETLDQEIQRLLSIMSEMQDDPAIYGVYAANVEALCRAKSYEKDRKVDVNTVIAAATNIAGILLILNHEQLHVISTKAFGLIGRIKL